jgi:uncharacterized protein
MYQRFAGFRVAAETRRTLSSECELHGILGSNGSTFVVNTRTSGWATGPKQLFDDLDTCRGDDFLTKYPELSEPLLKQTVRRKTYTEFNPWTVKVADHCNMACSYCYEDANPKVKKMSLATAAKVIDEMLALGQSQYVVLFHGGEPTLNMDVIRYMVHELRARSNGAAQVQFIIHTNLLNFPDTLHEELQSLGVQIGSSLDGVKELTDQYRVNLGGAGTYDTVTTNLSKLSNKYLITTVTNANHGRLLETARHFAEDLGVPGFHFLPLLPHGRPNVTTLCPDSDTMAESMLAVFDYIVEQWENGTRINCRNFDDIISALYADSYMDACQACCLNEFKSQSITINYDGTFAPCDVSAGYPEYALGNIHQCNGDLVDYMNSPRNFRVFKRLDNIEGCSTCAFKYSCAGGCEEESLRIGHERNHYCAYYYRLFAAVATNLYWLEHAGYTQTIPGVAHGTLVGS